jgi:hypothetical protein
MVDLKRARSWTRRIKPKEAYSSPGLPYSEACGITCLRQVEAEAARIVGWLHGQPSVGCRKNQAVH